VRYRTVPGIDGYPYAVRPFPVFGLHGTSLECLSWLCESPATPDLHPMTPERPLVKVQYAGGPVHQFSLVPRPWSLRPRLAARKSIAISSDFASIADSDCDDAN
jgi:hypothetical protein